MAKKANTYSGTCELCEQVETKARMGRHLAVCAPANDEKGSSRQLIQLRISAPGSPWYWLIIEARADATLEQLDTMLRRIWLECCGHMSAFCMDRATLEMTSKIGEAFVIGQKLDYEYDFGSTTALRGEAIGIRKGSLGKATVRLLARNDDIVWPCARCESPATAICPVCMDEGECLFCDEHAKSHPCQEEDAYLPVVNSPRMGVCGYTGEN